MAKYAYQNTGSNRTRSSVPGWIKCLKSQIKNIKRGIEGYSKLKIFKIYGNTLKDYFLTVKAMNPSKLCKMMSSYCSDCNPCKVWPKKVGCEIVILWIPILMVCLMWTLGLFLVLTIPPITFLVGFVLWIGIWPIVIIAPPLLYIGGTLTFLF